MKDNVSKLILSVSVKSFCEYPNDFLPKPYGANTFQDINHDSLQSDELIVSDFSS